MQIFSTVIAASLFALGASSAGFAVGAQVARANTPDNLDNNEGATPSAQKCLHISSHAPYRGFGYDHVVDIENKCDKAQTCTVRTDVNPEVQTVNVAAHETTSVVTFRGSPAREFKPDVQCKPAS